MAFWYPSNRYFYISVLLAALKIFICPWMGYSTECFIFHCNGLKNDFVLFDNTQLLKVVNDSDGEIVSKQWLALLSTTHGSNLPLTGPTLDEDTNEDFDEEFEELICDVQKDESPWWSRQCYIEGHKFLISILILLLECM